MEIRIESQIGMCEEFMAGAKEPKEPVSIVISPLKVISDELNVRVTNGCNMWQACQNQRCYFSAAGRRLPKVKGAGT